MEIENKLPTHPIYQVCDIKEADAVAWALTSKDSDLVMYPFKFPELGDNEVRLKILYSSLCQSDVMHGRNKWFGEGNVLYPIVVGHEYIKRAIFNL